jgi:hypothetical protein
MVEELRRRLSACMTAYMVSYSMLYYALTYETNLDGIRPMIAPTSTFTERPALQRGHALGSVLSIELRLPPGCSPAEARRALRKNLKVTPEGLLLTAIKDSLWESRRAAGCVS